MKNKINIIISSCLVVFLTIGISSSFVQDSDDAKKQEKMAKQRKSFDQNRSDALKAMYKAYPGSKAQMSKSYAYAAFANTGINLLVVASGNGGGKGHNNATGEEVYVKMMSYGAGVGIGFNSIINDLNRID